jgi:uridine phosphorylase
MLVYEWFPAQVGICATGMGCPSVDLIVTELIMLGGRRFFRVGTCGSLQPKLIRYGDLVVRCKGQVARGG